VSGTTKLLAALLPLIALGAASTCGCASLAFHRGAMAGEPPKATFVEIDGARVRYEDTGEGPPVVLVHGFASSLENWITVAPTLAKHHRVLSMDLKGFGWTDRPEGDYSPPAQAKLVLGLMKARGIDRADVVAHSWGASIALQMAMLEPKRVSRLALYDAWVYEEQLPTFFLWARADGVGEFLFSTWYEERADERIAFAFYDKKKWLTEPFIEAVSKIFDRPGTVAAALAATRGQRFSEWQEKYKTVQQDTLLLWGREDEVTLLSYGERLQKDLPHAKLNVYPQCGHFPMLEQAAASTADLDAFLAPLATATVGAADASDAPKSVEPAKKSKSEKSEKKDRNEDEK
jgi:pimeloyl-ACP methyl ester carboxylesterase